MSRVLVFLIVCASLCGCVSVVDQVVSGQLLPAPSSAPDPLAPTLVFPESLPVKKPVILSITPNSGPVQGGTLLSLIGSGFSPNGNSIWVGNVPCSFPNYISPSKITCVTNPNTPGTKKVALANLAGLIASFPPPIPSPSPSASFAPAAFTFQSGFTYQSAPPVLTGNTGRCPPAVAVQDSTVCPAKGSMAQPTLVTLSGNNFQEGAIATIGGQICCATPVTKSGGTCPSPNPIVNNTTFPNTLSCYAPPYPLAGSVPVTLINPDQQQVTSTDLPYTYVDPVGLAYSTTLAFYSLYLPIPINSPSIVAVKTPTYSISPALPPGLTLNANGTITGTPQTVTGPNIYFITAANANGSTTAAVIIGTYDFGTGNDGPLILASPTPYPSPINVFASINNTTLAPGATTLNVLHDTRQSDVGFRAGDQILVIQTQSTSTPLPYEYAKISSSWIPIPTPIPSTAYSITLESGLKHNYQSGTFNSPTGSLAAQIVRVPNYTNVSIPNGVTLGTLPWDGRTGGVLAFNANGNTNLDGTIQANTVGFRGGLGGNNCSVVTVPSSSPIPLPTPSSSPVPVPSTLCSPSVGYQGESLRKTPYSVFSPLPSPSPSPNATFNDGGGGGGSSLVGAVATGSGGGYGSIGTSGSAGSQGGQTYGLQQLLNLYLGSGGGGGSNSRSICSSLDLMQGGSGGGIVLVQSFNMFLSSTGRIQANGGNVTSLCGTGSSGGAGSGGSIYLRSSILSFPDNTITTQGGLGLTPGIGDGGNGRIRLDYNILTGPGIPTGVHPSTLPSPGHLGSP